MTPFPGAPFTIATERRRNATLSLECARHISALPRELRLRLGNQGHLIVTQENGVAESAGAPTADEMELLPVTADVWLAVERTAAAAIATNALGLESIPGAPGSFGSPVGHGLLMALVAAATARLGVGVSRRANETPPSVDELAKAYSQFRIRLEWKHRNSPSVPCGFARLFVANACLKQPASGRVNAQRIDRVSAQACVVAGRTEIAAHQLQNARQGDLVVFGGYLPPPLHQCELEIGSLRAPAEIAEGELRVQSILRPAASVGHTHPQHQMDDNKKTNAADSGAPAVSDKHEATTLAGEALANVPIEVTAELARICLRGDELAGLYAGDTLALGAATTGQVTLTVAGRPFAEGHLVALEGELGVHLDKLL